MENTEAAPGRQLDLGTHWRVMVESWAARGPFPTVADTQSLSLEFGIPETGRVISLRLMTTRKLLVAFMTDGQALRQDQLALAAAAANAWNTEQLVPMLSVWDVRGPGPFLAGVCDLPLTCRMTQQDFDVMARDWVDRARQMFIRCHQVFQL